MNLPELSVALGKWNKIKTEIPLGDVLVMEQVEKMNRAEREFIEGI